MKPFLFRQFAWGIIIILLGSGLSAIAQTFRAWNGISNNPPAIQHTLPPDTHGAAGPRGIIAVVNLCIAYFSKDGSQIWGPNLLPTGFFNNTLVTGNNSDPKAIFDPGSGRFFVIMQFNGGSPLRSLLFLAVSKNSDPRTGTGADWIFSNGIDMSQNVNGTLFGGDYPGLGVDGQALYVTYNLFPVGPNGVTGKSSSSQILIFDKGQLLAGPVLGAPPRVFATDGENLQPATPAGPSDPGNRMFFAEIVNGRTDLARLWTLDQPLGARLLDSDDIALNGNGGEIDNAPQLGTTLTVDTLSPRAMSAFWYDYHVWFCHTARGDVFSDYSKILVYRVYPEAGGTRLVETDTFDAGPGIWLYQPAIGVNYRGDMGIVFTESSASSYPAMYYSVRLATTARWGDLMLAQSSKGFANMVGNNTPGVSRWGDYGVVCADPADNTLWIAHEYAISSNAGDWGTWWVNLNVSHGDVYVDKNSFQTFENGTQQYPYKTVTAANKAATRGEVMKILKANYNEALTLDKPVQVQAPSGNVTIGAP